MANTRNTYQYSGIGNFMEQVSIDITAEKGKTCGKNVLGNVFGDYVTFVLVNKGFSNRIGLCHQSIPAHIGTIRLVIIRKQGKLKIMPRSTFHVCCGCCIFPSTKVSDLTTIHPG
jgi:hypothetical protein